MQSQESSKDNIITWQVLLLIIMIGLAIALIQIELTRYGKMREIGEILRNNKEMIYMCTYGCDALRSKGLYMNITLPGSYYDLAGFNYTIQAASNSTG